MNKVANPDIRETTQTVQITPEVKLFVKILEGPRRSSRTAIYVHGGGGGGNHSLLVRPCRKLIDEGYFDKVILPDRRGDGASTLLTRPITISEHAQDMKLLLDKLDEPGPLVSLGVSYGGPIALTLADIDPRVSQVYLVASSPSLAGASGIALVLWKTGLLMLMMKLAFRMYLGKLPPEYPDFDPAYDARSTKEMVQMYTEALKRTPACHKDSLLYALEATLDSQNAGVPEDIRLSLPVIQVVGNKDEVWGSEMKPEFTRRFPQYRQYRVPEGKIHKDFFLKPDAFYDGLARALTENLGK